MTVELTPAEIKLMLALLSLDPGALGLSNAQQAVAFRLQQKLRKGT